MALSRGPRASPNATDSPTLVVNNGIQTIGANKSAYWYVNQNGNVHTQ